MMWFDKNAPRVIFGDIRREDMVLVDGRRFVVRPDVQFDFRALPFPDGVFGMVVFDPPHLLRAGPRSWQAAKYGKLAPTWEDDLRRGFAECWRVLAVNGTLIFKWNETQLPVNHVLKLAPVPPLFGHKTKATTKWFVFVKTAFVKTASRLTGVCSGLAPQAAETPCRWAATPGKERRKMKLTANVLGGGEMEFDITEISCAYADDGVLYVGQVPLDVNSVQCVDYCKIADLLERINAWLSENPDFDLHFEPPWYDEFRAAMHAAQHRVQAAAAAAAAKLAGEGK